MTTAAAPDLALTQLRRARRHNRLADVHWIDALYRVYIAALGAGIFALVAAGQLPSDRLTPDEADTFLAESVAWLGLVVAVAVGIGLRSGGRGGPLVLEAPVVMHELNAPVDRGLAVRGPAVKQLRFLAFAGGVLGAIVGEVAARRLPVNVGAAVAGCALTFALAAVLAAGAAMALSGHRVRWFWANVAALGVIVWSAIDIAAGTTTSPATLLARVAYWPLSFDPLAFVGIVVALVIPVVGIAGLGGLSIEAAMRRAGLVSQLRFAVTLQDVRTVVLLRRQLSQERPRPTPWIRLGRGGRLPAVWRRDWQGFLRFPGVRLLRIVLLGVVAGLSMGMVWRGAAPMIVLAGVALYVAGYDAAEPIAQEVDHPTRWESYPTEPGRLLTQHAMAAFVIMLVVCLIAAASAAALAPVEVVASLTPLVVITVAGTAALAASIGSAQGAPDAAQMSALGPDMMGFVLLARLIIPPTLVVASLVPLLTAGHDPAALQIARVSNTTTWVLFAMAGAFAFLRFRKPRHL